MSERPFDDITRAVLRPISDAADSAINSVTSTIGPAFTAGATLYVMVIGIQIMRGQAQETLTEASKTAIKLGVIATLALNADMYRYWIVDVFSTAFADGIAKAFSGAPSADAARFDAVADKLWQMHARLWEGVSAWAPAKAFHATLLSGVLLICGLAFLVSAFITTLWAKAGMLYVLALGPVFLALALFEQTKKYTAAFFDQVVSFVVLQILVAALVGVCINAVDAEIQRPFAWSRATSLVGGMVALLVFCNATVLLLPSLANKLAGGFSASFHHRAPAQQVAHVSEAFGQARSGDPAGAGRVLRGLAFGARDGDVNASQSAVAARERGQSARSMPGPGQGPRDGHQHVGPSSAAPSQTALASRETVAATSHGQDSSTSSAPASRATAPDNTTITAPAAVGTEQSQPPHHLAYRTGASIVRDTDAGFVATSEGMSPEPPPIAGADRTETSGAQGHWRDEPLDLETFAPETRGDAPSHSEQPPLPQAAASQTPPASPPEETATRFAEHTRPASIDQAAVQDPETTHRRRT
jgi:type IV secretion system protein VirB6